MIRLLCKNLRLSDLTQRSTPHLCSLYCSINSPLLKSHQEPADPTSSLTVSFLVDSCGLPLSSALSAAKKVQLKSLDNPNSVLSLLKDHAFTDTHIANLVAKRPNVLLSDPEKTLKPKLEFFLRVGFSGPDLTKLLSLYPFVLSSSVDKTLSCNFSELKSLLGSGEAAVAVIGKSPRLLQYNMEKLLPKVKFLRDNGVPLQNIVKLATQYHRILSSNFNRLRKSVEVLKEMGLDPSSMIFVRGIKAMCVSKTSMWSKLVMYKSLGWSDEETISAFTKNPICMASSEEKIRRAMDFYVKRLHLKPSFLSARPTLLMYSLEKRIVPRCAVLTVLSSKGLVGENWNIYGVMMISEKAFLEKYVSKHSNKVPEVLEAYQGLGSAWSCRVERPSAGTSTSEDA